MSNQWHSGTCKANPLWPRVQHSLCLYLKWHVKMSWLVFHTCIRSSHSVSLNGDPYLFSYFRFSGSVLYLHHLGPPPFKEPLILHCRLALMQFSTQCSLFFSWSSARCHVFFVRGSSLLFIFHEADPYLLCRAADHTRCHRSFYIYHWLWKSWFPPLECLFSPCSRRNWFPSLRCMFNLHPWGSWFSSSRCSLHISPPPHVRELILCLEVFITSSPSWELIPFLGTLISPFIFEEMIFSLKWYWP